METLKSIDKHLLYAEFGIPINLISYLYAAPYVILEIRPGKEVTLNRLACRIEIQHFLGAKKSIPHVHVGNFTDK